MDFFDADRLASKDLAEIDFLLAQTDAATVGHDNDLVVERIIDIRQSLVVACGGLIDLGQEESFRYDEWLLMNDAQIRAATKQALLVQHMGDAETVIFEELGVQHGLARIDLAVVNGELHGFELKSARDTLARLPEQAESYGRVFDRVTLVVEERHVRGAVDLVPDWWGVRVACQESGKLRFCDLRHAVKNPSPDPAAIVALLWREEALHFLEELGIAEGVRWKCRAEIYSRLVTKTDIDVLCHRVRTCLRKRLNWRSAATRLSCGG